MGQNLWLYADKNEIDKTAIGLITFGASVFKRAKIIADLQKLKEIKEALNKKEIEPHNSDILEYAFENLIDTVRILVFFENYMKAALISKGFCVHRIDKNVSGFSKISSEQFVRPISLKEINGIEPFAINEPEKRIEHSALKETTIGMKELLSKQYLSFYNIEKDILNTISEMRFERNKLHFHGSIDFSISTELIVQMEKINEFVDKTIAKMKK